MYNFHTDSEWYFRMQKTNCSEYIIPFIEKTYTLVCKDEFCIKDFYFKAFQIIVVWLRDLSFPCRRE